MIRNGAKPVECITPILAPGGTYRQVRDALGREVRHERHRQNVIRPTASCANRLTSSVSGSMGGRIDPTGRPRSSRPRLIAAIQSGRSPCRAPRPAFRGGGTS